MILLKITSRNNPEKSGLFFYIPAYKVTFGLLPLYKWTVPCDNVYIGQNKRSDLNGWYMEYK